MRRISSRSTFFTKRVFPVIWFGFLGFAIITASGVFTGRKFHIETVLIPAGMAVFGFILMKRFVFDLVDQVWDDGDSLVVRNNCAEERIALTNIINVGYSNSRPPRVTLTLREPSAFGSEITFVPPTRFIAFSTHPIVTGLIRRIDEKRTGRA